MTMCTPSLSHRTPSKRHGPSTGQFGRGSLPMNDTTSAAPSDAEIDAQWRESVAKHETTAAFVRDFARAVLAKWGALQPALDCHHRPPCDECAAYDAQGGK